MADAKNRLSELVNRALADGPQVVRRRKDAVVVMDQRYYEELKGKRTDFRTFLLRGRPSLDDLDLSRDRSPMRDVAV